MYFKFRKRFRNFLEKLNTSYRNYPAEVFFIHQYLIGEKKSRGKVTKFLQVTKFFPDFLFPDQYFSPTFFHLTKNLSRFFSSRIIIINSHLFAKFIITIFFDVL